MLKRVMDKKHNEEGFTLIELLIVIVILGILASVVVFAVSGITDKGAASACKSDVKTLETAAEAYYAKNTAHAATATALKDAGFIRNIPDSDEYKIGFASGAVTSGPPDALPAAMKPGAEGCPAGD